MYLYGAPHVDFPMLANASAAAVPFLTAYWRCSLNRSSLSNMTPRYLPLSDGLTLVPSSVVMLALVDLRLLRVKWTSIYLDASNCAPCSSLHSSAWESSFFSLLTFSTADVPSVPY